MIDYKVTQRYSLRISPIGQFKTTQQPDLTLSTFIDRSWNAQTYTLKEGVWSLGGEAGLVLAAQNPVRKRELDLGVLLSAEETLKPVD